MESSVQPAFVSRRSWGMGRTGGGMNPFAGIIQIKFDNRMISERTQTAVTGKTSHLQLPFHTHSLKWNEREGFRRCSMKSSDDRRPGTNTGSCIVICVYNRLNTLILEGIIPLDGRHGSRYHVEAERCTLCDRFLDHERCQLQCEEG